MRQLSAIAGLLAIAACAKTELPPLPPRADLCIFYQPFRYSPAAAAVEALDALRAHAANEAAHHERCLLGDRGKSLGPR